MRRLLILLLLLMTSIPAFGKDPLGKFKFEFEPQYISYQIIYGGTLPTVCNPNTGDVFMLTAGVAGLHRCSAANTWSRVVSMADPGQTWTIGTDESWVLTTTTGWPAAFRHSGAAGFAISYQNLNTGYLFTDGTYIQLDTAGNFLIVNQEALNLVWATTGTIRWTVGAAGELRGEAITQAALPASDNGSIFYCSDCTIANPCAGGGTGAIAKRLNGVWVCN